MIEENGTRAPLKLEGQYKALAVCWFLGLGSLVAWNSMLTIGDYYYNLFPTYHPSRVLTLVYQPFAFVTMATLAYHEAKVDTRKRNLIGYALFFLATLMLTIVDVATSAGGGVGPYIGICACVAAFGVADAHVQGGMVGDLSLMRPEFIQSFFAGLAASGALTSGLRLMTKAAFEKSHDGLRKGTMLFLTISTFTEFLCILLYAFYFPRLPIVKYYRSKAASEGSKTVTADLAAAGVQTQADIEVSNDAKVVPTRLSTMQIFKQNIDFCLDLFLICADIINLPWFHIRKYWKSPVGDMVSPCPGCNVQCVGFDIAIHTPHQMPEDRVQKGSPDCNPIAFPLRSSVLLHRKVR
ncbi:hypothetical protein ACFX2A_005209 [Malus domestica]